LQSLPLAQLDFEPAIMLCKTLLVILQAVTGALAATSWIAPGAVWYDTDGKKIDAHGGGVVKRGDTFYWVGQSASNSKATSYNSHGSDRGLLTHSR
jgi:hypothetical protein